MFLILSIKLQCSPFKTPCLGSIRMDHVLSELCYKWTILQRTNRKMTILWSFSYKSFVKFYGKKLGSNNMIVLYPNTCYNEVCYKETVLYLLKQIPSKYIKAGHSCLEAIRLFEWHFAGWQVVAQGCVLAGACMLMRWII